MAITISAMSALIGRYNNKLVVEQANLAAPLLKSGVLKKLNLPKEAGVVNIKAGEPSSIAIVGDGQTLPTASNVTPVQGTYLPVAFIGHLDIPRVAAHVASGGDDGIELVVEQMQSLGEGLGRNLERACLSSNLGSPQTAVTDNVSTTFEVRSPAGWRVGMLFEVYNGSTAIEGTTNSTPLYVTNVSIPADPASNTTITFVGTGTAGAASENWTTSYTLYPKGGGLYGGFTSFGSITAAASLYGVAHTGNEWSGSLDSSTTALSLPAMRQLCTLVIRRRGQKPSHVVVNRLNAQRYSDLLLNNRRFISGKMDGVGGSDSEFEGIPLVETENCDDSDLFMVQSKDVKLHVFRDFAPDFDGLAKKGMDRGALIVDSSSLSYKVQVWGAFQMRCEKRNGFGRMSALAS